jgi:hypothetical protein
VTTTADEHVRGQARSATSGEVFAGLNGVQGLGVLLAGAAAGAASPAFARTGDHIAVGARLGRPSEA